MLRMLRTAFSMCLAAIALHALAADCSAGCYQINYPPPPAWTPANYYTGVSVGADGWINGLNIYLDKEKAMYFDASSLPYTYMTGVMVLFGVAGSGTPSKLIALRIYDGTDGTPGAQIGSSHNVTMGTIIANTAAGAYTFFWFPDTPITIPASKKFFASIDVTNLTYSAAGTPGRDELSITSNTAGQTVPSAIWERQSNNLWYRYTTAGSWNLSASLYIHPFLTDTVDPVPYACQEPCPAGTYYDNATDSCAACPAGSYCPGADSLPGTCPDGTFSPAESSSVDNCSACPAGYYCTAGAIEICPAGSSCPEGSETPAPCPAGFYAADNGSTACTACPAGLTSSAGAASCTPITSTTTTMPPACSDLDGDGYGENCAAGNDCNDTDAFYTDICPDCRVLVIPGWLGWLIGDREKTRMLFVIGPRDADFDNNTAVRLESSAITVFHKSVLFKRFMLLRARFNGELLEKQSYRILVGTCEGSITWAR